MKVYSFILLCVICDVISGTPVDLIKGTDKQTKGIKDQKVADSLAEASSDYGEDVYVETPQRQLIHHAATLTDTFLPEGHSIPDHSIELQGGSQTFFPSFASLFQQQQQRQPLGHSRPLASYNQEGAYSQRPNALRQLLNYQTPSFGSFRSNSDFKSTTQASDDSSVGSSSSGLLGSGNFNVIRGGTFLGENSDTESISDTFDNAFFNNNNGHGRPSYFFNGGNPRPSYNQDQFANFRDFADINSPSNSPAYSHFVVVYANRNATIGDIEKTNSDLIQKLREKEGPKNIIERLEQIDREKQNDKVEAPKPSKLSRSKQKLLRSKEKKTPKTYKKVFPKASTAKELADPLIALS